MERSIQTIMSWLTNTVQEKKPISPQQFVEASAYLVILMGEEHAKLYDMEQKVAQIKLKYIELDKSVAEAKVRVETTEEYKEMKKQQAFIEQISEMVRLAKLLGRMKQDEQKLN